MMSLVGDVISTVNTNTTVSTAGVYVIAMDTDAGHTINVGASQF